MGQVLSAQLPCARVTFAMHKKDLNELMNCVSIKYQSLNYLINDLSKFPTHNILSVKLVTDQSSF